MVNDLTCLERAVAFIEGYFMGRFGRHPVNESFLELLADVLAGRASKRDVEDPADVVRNLEDLLGCALDQCRTDGHPSHPCEIAELTRDVLEEADGESRWRQ
jgi:hypothetical protein